MAEGFVAVHQINPAQEKAIGEVIREKIKSIPRSITNRKSRTAKYTLHRYSRLRDFERLMHLIALTIEYPGIGNLQTTAPQILENIFRTVPKFPTAIEEITAIVSKRRGQIYANPQELAIDLEWLERNGIIGTREVDAEIKEESDRASGSNVIAQDLGGEGIWVLPVLHSYSGHRTGVNSPCTASECLTGQEQFLRSENFSNAYGVGGFDLEVVSRQPSARICS
ncbi:MAG: hypothetical protein GDA56_08565 [Hormoscilla sp. GM7CHS1pb]|nr:hypothetical protein [Hormoscilla sp. GM7CHS1pb]